MENANNYKLANKVCDYIVNQIDFGRKISIWDIEKILNDNIPLEPLVSLKFAEIEKIIEKCAKIAERYEPDEKLDYVDYASGEIRKLKNEYC